MNNKMKVITLFVDMTRHPSDAWKNKVLDAAEKYVGCSVETNIQTMSSHIEDGALILPVSNDPRIMFVDRGKQYYFAEVHPQYCG